MQSIRKIGFYLIVFILVAPGIFAQSKVGVPTAVNVSFAGPVADPLLAPAPVPLGASFSEAPGRRLAANELTIVFVAGRCGYVDEGQVGTFYAFAYEHFGAKRDLRAVPFSTYDAAVAVVNQACSK